MRVHEGRQAAARAVHSRPGEARQILGLKLKSDQDRTYGHSHVLVTKLRPSLCLETGKGGTGVNLKNYVNYYYALQALRFLRERGLLSEEEFEKASRYCAGIFQPERGSI